MSASFPSIKRSSGTECLGATRIAGAEFSRNLMETPGAQCPRRLKADTELAQFDKHERRFINGHEKVRAAFRHLDEAKQSGRASAFEPDRARTAVRIERAERERDARFAGVQLLKQVNCGFGVDTRQRQIDECGRPHRRRARGAAKFGHHHQDLAKPALGKIASRGKQPPAPRAWSRSPKRPRATSPA